MFSDAQATAIAAVVAQYAKIKGAYAETVLQGIAHYYADSGIITDAYAAHNKTLHETVIAKLAAIAGDDIEDAAVYAAQLEDSI